MRLNEFAEIAKQQPLEKLSAEGFKDKLRLNCKNSHRIAKQYPLFASSDEKGDFFIVNPKKRDNRSGFWIDRLVTDLRSWDRFPGRERCMRMYTAIDKVGGEEAEDVFVVIPFDGAKLGVSGQISFYRSFKNVLKALGSPRVDNTSLGEWIKRLAAVIHKLTGAALIEAPEDYKGFTKTVKTLDGLIGKHHDLIKKKLRDPELKLSDDDRKLIDLVMGRRVVDLHTYLQEQLDPEENGFTLARVESFTAHGPHEVWTESSCLLVRRQTYVEMFNQGDIK